MRILVALCFVACASPRYVLPTREGAKKALCQSKCGLLADSNCAELQSIEDVALAAFEKHTTLKHDQMCKAIAGWYLTPHIRRPWDKKCGPYAWWLLDNADGRPFCAVGYTATETWVIESPNNHWRKNWVAHELMHVINVTLFNELGHCRWKERGINAAILEIYGVDDPSEPEEQCRQTQIDSGQPTIQ